MRRSYITYIYRLISVFSFMRRYREDTANFRSIKMSVTLCQKSKVSDHHRHSFFLSPPRHPQQQVSLLKIGTCHHKNNIRYTLLFSSWIITKRWVSLRCGAKEDGPKHWSFFCFIIFRSVKYILSSHWRHTTYLSLGYSLHLHHQQTEASWILSIPLPATETRHATWRLTFPVSRSRCLARRSPSLSLPKLPNSKRTIWEMCLWHPHLDSLPDRNSNVKWRRVLASTSNGIMVMMNLNSNQTTICPTRPPPFDGCVGTRRRFLLVVYLSFWVLRPSHRRRKFRLKFRLTNIRQEKGLGC